MTFQEKRKAIEKLVLDSVKLIDVDKMENLKRYEIMFKQMTDKEFSEWASSMGHELDDTIQIFQMPFKTCSLEQIKDLLDYLGVPMEEYIWYRNKGGVPIRSKYKMPVGWIPDKRMQQFLTKKNLITLDSDKRSLKSGQTTGDSKVSSITDLEAYMLTSLGADQIMKELYVPRADGFDQKGDFYKQINDYGTVELNELEEDLTQRTTLNVINTYLIASGLRSDLVTNTLKTAYTIKKDIKGK